MATRFSEFVNSETPALVDFYTEWWDPCKAMSPILQELKSRIGDQAKIVMLNLDRNPKAVHMFDVKDLPTLILFRKGKIVWRQSGVLTADHLKGVISRSTYKEPIQ